MTIAFRYQFGRVHFANFRYERTAGMEFTTRRRVNQIRRASRNAFERLLSGTESRCGIEQTERIGVAWAIKNIVHWPNFDDIARVHGGDAVSDFGSNGQIVA